MTQQCKCQTGPEWSGSPNPKNPDNEWVCDDCGRVIPADGTHAYIAGYNGEKLELHAPNKVKALELAKAHFKPPKSKLGLLWVELADADTVTVITS